MPKLSFDWRAHAALFLAALIYGGNYTVAKLVMNPGYVGPLAFIILRVGGAALLVWLFHALYVRERLERRDLQYVLLCAVFGVALNMTFFFSGLKLTTPINASLIMTVTPILVLVFSAVLLSERITRRKLLGIATGAAGAILLITYQHHITLERAQLLGNLMVFINAASYGLYLVLVKSLMVRYQPLTVIKWVFTLGLPLIVPFGWSELRVVEWSSFPPVIWGAVAYVIVGTTFLTYLSNSYALSRVPASTVGIYVYLQPLIAAVIAVGLGQESLTGVKVAAGLLIFTGVWLVSKKRSTAKVQSAEAGKNSPGG